MTKSRPIMVPNNDGTKNTHQVNPVTNIDSVVGLRAWMNKIEKQLGVNNDN